MLKKAFTLALLAVNFVAAATPAPTDMQFGAISLRQSAPKNLHHSGMLQLDGVKVANETIINGFLTAKNSQFHELTVNGQCQLENTELLGPVSVNGQLQLRNVNADAAVTVYGFLGARKTVFTKPITVTTTNVDFIDSTFDSLTVDRVKDQTQTVNLTRTKVSGDITFTSGKGLVKMDPSSSIMGKVNGGTIEKVAAKPEEKKQ